ncbi:hypothetical protein, partial [Burkholderia metallica]|uniref:hypothetical protein n=1 Tax=Burkholderia metallica TaxID=488729 RepID=UPI001CF284C6
NNGSCISSIPRIGSSAQDHEHDISNAPPFEPVYTVPNFNSLLGLLRQVIKTIDKAIPGDSIKFSLKQDHDNLRLGAAVEANLGDALKCHIDLHGEG